NVSIGRDQSQDFVLDHPTVSRQHAMIIDDGDGQFRLVVLSKGGLTAVDGQRVDGETRLYDGTQLYFGKLSFQFRSDQAPAKPAGAGTGTVQTAGGRSGASPSQAGAGADGGRDRGGPADGGSGGAGPSMPEETVGGDRGSSNESASERAGIESWDEIAKSAEDEEEEEEDRQEPARQQSTSSSGSFSGPPEAAQPAGMEGTDDGGEETNPVVVIAGVLGIVLMLGYSFWPRGGNGGPQTSDPLEKKDPEKLVKVECLSEKKCLKEAKASSQVGAEYLEKQDSEVGNLFQGYKRLLEAKAYLEQAGSGSTPKKLSDLQSRVDKAREKLDGLFRNYQVKFRSAQKNGQPRKMAGALRTIQQYFPDKRAPEYQWANEKILRMKRKGNYPSDF
ncbi:MAG: FHA domain-containing protein, partial [Bradymonadaceae bacterium]